MTENEISYKIEEAILKVYDELGPGLLEPVYEAALCYQMKKYRMTKSNLVKCICRKYYLCKRFKGRQLL
ncbi:hypothetical protein prwr041_07840 [Prevotella herbatica]|uniref:GxxExxY protein n=1 Tax=Prevotella herbatica TaxID=2801997 RepID=A0ABM7NWK6_9BACT|nr:GxxExxY protein [Prevotella herbatica]BCS84891.1 hypothetical protein prwr041_07840 [Prevotella herbatica]